MRRYDSKLSHEKIARTCGVSKGAVGILINPAKAKGLTWPLPEDVDGQQLKSRLFQTDAATTLKSRDGAKTDYGDKWTGSFDFGDLLFTRTGTRCVFSIQAVARKTCSTLERGGACLISSYLWRFFLAKSVTVAQSLLLDSGIKQHSFVQPISSIIPTPIDSVDGEDIFTFLKVRG